MSSGKVLIGIAIKVLLTIIVIKECFGLDGVWWENVLLILVLYAALSLIVNIFMTCGLVGIGIILGYIFILDLMPNETCQFILGIITYVGSVIFDIGSIICVIKGND